MDTTRSFLRFLFQFSAGPSYKFAEATALFGASPGIGVRRKGIGVSTFRGGNFVALASGNLKKSGRDDARGNKYHITN